MKSSMLVLMCSFPIIVNAQVNLVKDGDFEQAPLNTYYFPHSVINNAWEVPIYGVYVQGDWQAASGLGCLLFDSYQGVSVIQQQFIPTVHGEQYLLRFAMAGNATDPISTSSPIKRMQVYVADQNTGTFLVNDTLQFDVTGHSSSDMGWTYYQYYFTSVNGSVDLNFNSSTFAAVDDVSIIAVPEPSTLIGMLILVLFITRKR